MQVTVSQAIDTLKAIGDERAKVVHELSYSAQMARLSETSEFLLNEHIKILTSSYSKLLEQVDKYTICN